ncbi:MAG TPA: molecular chaperone DnaJ [bacterium]|nr:molecular chaperone DnaJ [bacterium]
MKRCYYEILELDRQAGDGEIKTAYRKKALEFHPDRNPSHEAEERFKEASEAYEVLSDPQKRSLYDRFGHAGLQRQGFHGFDDVGDVFSHFSDIFEDFFGFSRGGGRRGGPQPGRDIRFDIRLKFSEAFSGIEQKIDVPRQEECELCGGQGYPKGQEPLVCRHCGGKGELYQSRGFFTISTTCNACQGHGKVVKEHCKDCRGQGSVAKSKRLTVKVPPGVDNGTQLCLRGEGEAGRRGGPRGDLYVVLTVEEDERFQRQGPDLHHQRKVSMVAAALGEEIEVPVPEGGEKLRIPPGAQTGDVLKLSGKGMPSLRDKRRGDLHVHLFVETPRDLSPEQAELLQAFRKTLGDSPGPESSFTKSRKKSKKSRTWFGT